MVSHLPYQIDPLRNRHHFFEENWKQCAAKLLLAKGCHQGKLLDWGCGRGEALAIFSRMGFDVRGADMDPACVQLSKVFGHPVDLILSEDPLSLYPPECFDVVVCLHVLEHVDSPTAVLSARRSQGKVRTFFFEKKNQKTFMRLHARQMISKRMKSFCFFFFRKRRALLSS